MNFTFQSYNRISTCQTILLFLYVYLWLKKIWNTRKIILLSLENIIPRLKRSHETVFQDSSFPRYGGADSWFNFLIRGKNRFSSAIRLSSTPFAIPRAPTLGMQPSFFFFFFTWFPLFYLFTRTTHNFCQWFISTWRVYSFVSPFSRLRSFRNALLPEFR